MTLDLNHIRRLRGPMSSLLLSAMLIWFITPDVHGVYSSTTYFKHAGDQITILLDLERSAPAQSAVKEYSVTTITYDTRPERIPPLVQTTPDGTLVLKVLYSTLEINAP